jgi:hypothetical protein
MSTPGPHHVPQHRAIVVSLALGVSGIVADRTEAAVVFSNFNEQAPPAFNLMLSAASPQNPGGEYELAAAFTVTGSDYLLDSVTLPILAWGGQFGGGQTGTSAYLTLYASGGNPANPGVALETTAVFSNLVFDINGPPPVPPAMSISFSGTTLLQAGQTYWLGVAETGGTAVGWLASSSIPNLQVRARTLPDGAWQSLGGSGIGVGLQVHGTAVPAAPGITLLALWGAGLIRPGLRRRGLQCPLPQL